MSSRVEELRGECEDWHFVGSTNDYGVTFSNSWANVGGASDPPAAFMKDKMGFVHLIGRIDTGTTGTVAFTLPVGYRPAYHNVQIVSNNNGGPGPGGATVRIDLTTNGNVTPYFSAGTDMRLDGVIFRAA